jgi:hypothetical protein
MNIVNNHEDWLLVGRRREQRQGASRNEETIRHHRARAPPERRLQRPALQRRNPVDEAAHGGQHLQQRGMAERRLGLDPAGTQHPEPVSRIGRRLKQ